MSKLSTIPLRINLNELLLSNAGELIKVYSKMKSQRSSLYSQILPNFIIAKTYDLNDQLDYQHDTQEPED